MVKSKLSSECLFGMLFALTALISCTPRLGSAVALVGLILLSFSTVLINSKSVVKNGSSLTFLIIAYLFIIFIYRILEISGAAWGRYAVYTYLELQVLLMLLIPQKIVNARVQWVWWVMSAIIALNILWNSYILYVNPELSAVYTLVAPEIMKLMNVGGSDFYVMALLFFDVCFFVFLNSRGKKVRYATLLLSVLSGIYVVWFCLKASVVVLWIFSVVFLWVTRKVRRIEKFFLVSCIVSVLAMLLVTTFSDEIIQFVVDLSPSERISKRLVMLIDANNMEASDSSYNARVDLWFSSIYTWLGSAENFLIGVGDHWGDLDSGVGQHSEFIDLLAKYGLIGSSIMFAILIKSFKFILSMFDKKYRFQLLVIITVYILCGITKRVFFDSVGTIFYLLLPLSAMLVNEEQFSLTVRNKYKKYI